MKKAASVAILITLFVIGIFGLDYFSAMRSYNELRKEAGSPVFEVVAIGPKEQEFLNEVRSSWRSHEFNTTDHPMMKMCELTGFEPTVEGLHAMFTHEVPPFSIFDKNQNLKEVGRAGALSKLKQIPTKGKVYWKDGVLYMMIRDDILEYYEDTNTGIRNVLYKK